MTSACHNCSYPLEEEFQYCPKCSQKTHLDRLTLHDILHDALHYFTHADKGFLGLIKELALKTGVVAKEFTAGKRKSYFPPLNFYLLVATIFVLVIHGVAPNTPFDVKKEHPELANIPDKAKRQYVQTIYERQHEAISFMNKYSNTVAMIAVPLLCFLYWLFYMRGKYNYTEHLVACMYMVGFANLVYAVIFVPLSLLLGIKQSSRAALLMVIIFMIFQIIYSSIFYYRFMDKGTRASAWKATGASIFVVLFWFTLSTFLVGLYIANGFWGLAAT
jgi:hypothetical protein